MKKTVLWVLPLLVVLGSIPSFGQATNSGDIRGSVTDASGALIPGVMVTVVNIDTGVSKAYVTNDSGLYDTNSIVAGSYTVTFTKEGFEKLVRGPVTVQVGLTTLNGELKVGASTQEITVSADVIFAEDRNERTEHHHGSEIHGATSSGCRWIGS